MAKALFALVLGAVCLLAVGPVLADWVPADGHNMHFPQLPDEQGWGVNAGAQVVLADDWQCTETSLITDIHFWGSWRDVTGDGVGDSCAQSFLIGIWSDVPDPDGTGPLFSHPGSLMWFGEVNNPAAMPIDPPTLVAWFDPSKNPDVVVPNDHGVYSQYNVFFDQAGLPPFTQVAGTIYWLSISTVLAPGPPPLLPYEWGWNSTIDHFNDDAVWALESDELQWTDIYEPPRYNEFSFIIHPFGGRMGSGTNFYGYGWYYYENTNWSNIWFYDNPFTYEHVKRGRIQCMIEPMDPLQPSNVTVALNWSTDAWSLQVPPPEGPPVPPLTHEQEMQFIGRQIIFDGPIGPGGREIYEPFQLPVGYNPEWISVDIQGVNVNIFNGVISHECVGTSLDLAFVINGPEPNCCVGRVGDANGQGEYPDEVTLGDIMLMVDAKFISGDCSILPCIAEADVNQDGGATPNCDEHVTLGDIMTLVDFLFITGPDVAVLPECL